MMLLWACAGVPLGVYNIVENFNIALRIQPQILTTLSLLTWMQCKYYGNKWPLTKALAVATPIAAVMGGIECGLIFALRRARDDHVRWPITFMAVLSACFLSAGVLRHYWDIYQERTVRGISFLFVGIDALGDLTSLISVLFEPSLNILGFVIYGSELILWLGVFACGGYCESGCLLMAGRKANFANLSSSPVNFRPWLRRRRVEGRSARECGGDHVIQSLPRRSSESSSVFRTASGVSHATVRLRTLTVDPAA